MRYKEVLIVGEGGREHALGWAMKRFRQDVRLTFAPGNAGTATIGCNVDIASSDIPGLARYAKEEEIDLTVVGPEQPLVDGIVDAFGEDKLSIVGPTQQAAQIESSKVFSNRLMDDHDIPHPKTETFVEEHRALSFVDRVEYPIVIKASGLAAGKGVILPETREEARQAVIAMMREHRFGDAGREIVIQERLQGKELSVIAFCDGEHLVYLLPTRDHKRLGDNDSGPNTGGMGTVAPVYVDDNTRRTIHSIMQKTVNGMRQEGTPFTGVLFAGMMLTSEGPKVLEYNCRLGDPEAQVLMRLLESDLFSLLNCSKNGRLKDKKISFSRNSALCVVLASAGYPEATKRGTTIYIPDRLPPSVTLFHAATRSDGKTITSTGGRVLGVSAKAPTFKQAQTLVYSAIGEHGVHFDGMQYRKDIGV